MSKTHRAVSERFEDGGGDSEKKVEIPKSRNERVGIEEREF